MKGPMFIVDLADDDDLDEADLWALAGHLRDTAPVIANDLIIAMHSWFDHLPPVVDGEDARRAHRMHELLAELDGLRDDDDPPPDHSSPSASR